MKKITIASLILLFFNANIIAQSLDWIKGVGGTAFSHGQTISVDALGNVYTIGHFSGTVDFDPGTGTDNHTAIGLDEVFIQKLDAAGNFIWAKSFGGSNTVIVYSSVIDNSGNILIAGGFFGSVDFDPNAGTANLTALGTDLFIQKLDMGGNYIWAKTVAASPAEHRATAVDAFGNVYTGGYFNGTVDFDPNSGISNLSAMKYDGFMQKLDAAGNLVWAINMGRSIDSTSYYDMNEMKIDASGNIYAIGGYIGTLDFNPSNSIVNNLISNGAYYDVFVQKIKPIALGIKIQQQSSIKLYPNPSNGLFQIELPNGINNALLQIIDNVGKVVYQTTLNTTRSTIDINYLSSGIYHITTILNSGTKNYDKLILNK